MCVRDESVRCVCVRGECVRDVCVRGNVCVRGGCDCYLPFPPCYRFCQGCAIPCDDGPLGTAVKYVAVDWDPTALHLKYQHAQERVRGWLV